MKIKELKLSINDIRKNIVKMVYEASSGHPGGALGMADLFGVLYFEFLVHDPKKPNSEERDFVFLSNGHTCPVLYSTLAQCGYFKKSELKTFRQINSKLQGHPHYFGEGTLPGVENSGGPLGQGISQAVGLAASLKRDGKENKVYCFIGDGESNEGQVWEAMLYAGANKLDNLTVIMDRNNIQIDGSSGDVLSLEPANKKLAAFNFAVISFNGNNIKQIREAFKEGKKIKNKPKFFLAKTIPGKHVSFMENNFKWHGKNPSKEEYEEAIVDLTVVDSKIKGGEI